MALTLDLDHEEVIGLDEYVDYVEREVDVDDVDSLCASTPRFKALLNNRTLIADLIDRQLRNWRDFQSGNTYVGQTLMLARRPRFFLRANMWLPQPSDAPAGPKTLDAIAHDHNFMFMTGGYLGSGYGTVIYEYDARSMTVIPGDKVDLRFSQRTTLPQGKMMLYRATEDVHYQERPHEFSISINLVVPTLAARRPQHFFDIRSGRLAARDDRAQGRPLGLCELARHVGGETTAQLLGDLVGGGTNPYIRAAAFESLRSLAPEAGEELGRDLLGDPDPYVRSVIHAALDSRCR